MYKKIQNSKYGHGAWYGHLQKYGRILATAAYDIGCNTSVNCWLMTCVQVMLFTYTAQFLYIIQFTHVILTFMYILPSP